jgi:hypothetical protein
LRSYQRSIEAAAGPAVAAEIYAEAPVEISAVIIEAPKGIVDRLDTQGQTFTRYYPQTHMRLKEDAVLMRKQQ